MKIKIHEESDLFSAFDPDQDVLSEDIFGYIIRCFQHMKTGHGKSGVIQICSDIPVDEENVKDKIRKNFRREKDVINRALNLLFFKAACLGIFGAAVLSVWLFLSAGSESVALEILSIVGWVAVWETANILIIERHDLQYSKKNMDRIINSEIVFQKTNTP